MANSVNKIMLIGCLGNDAETRFTTTNLGITSFSLATTHSYKGKDGNWVNETTWHNIIGFNFSDNLKAGLLKGKKFYVEGRLTKRDYTDKEGVKRYVTEIVAEKVIPLDREKKDGDSYAVPEQNNSSAEETPEEDDLPF